MKFNKLNVLLFVLLSVIATYAHSGDLGFRFKNGECVNGAGQKGLNPSFIGQCSDLRNVVLGRFDLSGIDFSGSQFTNSDLQQSSFAGANLTGASFEAANLAGVNFASAKFVKANLAGAIMKNAKLTNAEFHVCDLSRVNFTGADLSYLNFEGSKFNSTIFKNAKLEETVLKNADLTAADFEGNVLRGVDLSGSVLKQANLTKADMQEANLSLVNAEAAVFTNAQMYKANLTKAKLSRADLRRVNLKDSNLTDAAIDSANLKNADFTGANYTRTSFKDSLYTSKTLLPFNDSKAKQLGMIFINVNMSVLVIWDVMNDNTQAMVTALEKEGYEVTLSPMREEQFKGEGLDVGSVIHLNGVTDGVEMQAEGQRALVQFVKNGGKYIGMAWNAYEIKNGRNTQMSELVLISYDTEGAYTVVKTPGMSHPILEGMPNKFKPECQVSAGALRSGVGDGAQVLMKQEGTENATLAVKALGSGMVVDLAAISGNYQGADCLKQDMVNKLLINILNWTN